MAITTKSKVSAQAINESPSQIKSAPTQINDASLKELQEGTTGCLFTIQRFGLKRSLNNQDMDTVSGVLGAERPSISAQKSLLNKKNAYLKALVHSLGALRNYWILSTVPFPEDGVRLLRRADIPVFDKRMNELKAEFERAAHAISEHYEEIKMDARQRLGNLYHEEDYPVTLDGCYQVSWSFAEIRVPDYLRKLSPEIFAREQERIIGQFADAVRLTEEAFIAEFKTVLANLTRALTDGDEGKKILRTATVEKMETFFNRFEALNCTGNKTLSDLIKSGRSIMHGIAPDDLRKHEALRADVRKQLEVVQQKLEQDIILPRRNIGMASPAPAPENPDAKT